MTPPPPDFHATADLIRQEHLKAARESVQDLDIRRQLEDEIERDCDWLLHYLSAAQVRVPL